MLVAFSKIRKARRNDQGIADWVLSLGEDMPQGEDTLGEDTIIEETIIGSEEGTISRSSYFGSVFDRGDQSFDHLDVISEEPLDEFMTKFVFLEDMDDMEDMEDLSQVFALFFEPSGEEAALRGGFVQEEVRASTRAADRAVSIGEENIMVWNTYEGVCARFDMLVWTRGR